MTYLNELVQKERLLTMKRNARRELFENGAKRQMNKDDAYRNHIACQTEHLWYVARAVEQIAKAMGVYQHISPTESGRKHD